MLRPKPAKFVLFTFNEIMAGVDRTRQFNEAKEIENWSTVQRQLAVALHMVIKFEEDWMSPMLDTVTDKAYSVSSYTTGGRIVIAGGRGACTSNKEVTTTLGADPILTDNDAA